MYKDAVVSGTSTYIFVVLLLPLVVHSRIEGLHTTMTFSASTDYYLDPVVCGMWWGVSWSFLSVAGSFKTHMDKAQVSRTE